jgi:diadenosine tetraphosphatase ApaH/serine/threonine PP2A family protein phosphatase
MRVAVLSDIHANLAALDAVLGSLGTVDAIWHLGDVVGYGPEPDGVVERLVAVSAIGVRGNHDDAAIGGESIETFAPDAHRAAEWTRGRIGAATRVYLAGLPERLVPGSPGGEYTLVHGSPRDPLYEYLHDPDDALGNLDAFATAYCLVGHTHVPMLFREDRGRVRAQRVEAGDVLELDSRRAFLNPGSVGQPRDGDPRAAFMLIDTEAGLVTWQRVKYDIDSTQAAILVAGLPGHLAARLAKGR